MSNVGNMTNQSSNIIVSAQALSKSYNEGDLRTSVLSSVDFTAKKGETIAIIGSSGSGKSTLMHILGGLDSPDSGSVFLAGQNLNTVSDNQRGMLRNKHLGFVYQFHHLLGDFSAVENVAMPLIIGGVDKKRAHEMSKQILSDVGLSHRFNHRPGELSGGERQRVAIARSVVNNPSCVLADEPTGNLDRATADSVFDTLLSLNEKHGMCIIMVTHDNELASRMGIQKKLVNGSLKTL